MPKVPKVISVEMSTLIRRDAFTWHGDATIRWAMHERYKIATGHNVFVTRYGWDALGCQREKRGDGESVGHPRLDLRHHIPTCSGQINLLGCSSLDVSRGFCGPSDPEYYGQQQALFSIFCEGVSKQNAIRELADRIRRWTLVRANGKQVAKQGVGLGCRRRLGGDGANVTQVGFARARDTSEGNWLGGAWTHWTKGSARKGKLD